MNNLRTPNEEQFKAIHHFGGIVLSAGAGSGKTFVLIEHLIFLLSNVMKVNKEETWNQSLREMMSKVVLMTFTKKATGEIAVRFSRRIDQELKSSESDIRTHNFWKLVKNHQTYLNITTIDGFCLTLIRRGYFSKFITNVEIIDDVQHEFKIHTLFHDWINLNQKDIDQSLLTNLNSLKKAMVEIFKSSELRMLWDNVKLDENIHDIDSEIDQFFKAYLNLSGISTLFTVENLSSEISKKEIDKPWAKLYLDFFALVEKEGMLNSKNWKRYFDLLKEVNRFPVKPKAPEYNIHNEQLALIQELRKKLKEIEVDFVALTVGQTVYLNWLNNIKKLFDYISGNYFPIGEKGLIFSDLEYYVHQGLNELDTVAKIKKDFNYFIVDEFQDTSNVQFEIFKKISNNNLANLFAVGDKKQAIYGFRGGELQVFDQCSKLVGEANNYLLKNNFRSATKVVHFNNSFFKDIFPLGIAFSGHDPYSVEMEVQDSVSRDESNGKVVVLKSDIQALLDNTDEDKLTIDSLEAEIIACDIESQLAIDPKKTICVLYRKLSPSKYLLESLLKKSISYSAQIKIDYGNDPVIQIYKSLLQLYQVSENDLVNGVKKLNTLISVIKGEQYKDHVNLQTISQFKNQVTLFGFQKSFEGLFLTLGLTNSLYDKNLQFLQVLSDLFSDDVLRLSQILISSHFDKEYSLESMSGGASEKARVLIMTTHASKGLEFDKVYLAGVHTNGNYLGFRSFIGKMPGSFKWKNNFNQKKWHKTPAHYLESEILKYKDFSESKRLLYVACTRAVEQLSWVDLTAKKEVSVGENSWINALRKIDSSLIQENVQSLPSKIKCDGVNPPPIFKDYLGISPVNSNLSVGHLPELSVTGLSVLAQCPFKFYLKNICQIVIDEKKMYVENDEEEFLEDDKFYSSKDRGINIHSVIEKNLVTDMTEVNLSSLHKFLKNDQVTWLVEEWKKIPSHFLVIKEKLIKFSFFGHMISGTPDVVFQGEESIIIWDYKTGSRDPENESSYWFQLESYALGYAQLQNAPMKSLITLSLVYIDEKLISTKTYTFNQVLDSLFSKWKNLESLNQVIHTHCNKCEYSGICHNYKSSSH